MIAKFGGRSVGLLALLTVLGVPPSSAQDSAPQTTPEGLELVRQTRSRVTYAMPGATLAPYSKVALIECYVAFEKDWERDYNRTASFERRVSADDMERIKTELAAEFQEVFAEVLTEAGYEVVDYAGEDVMIVRPAIINLEVQAPDTGVANYSDVIVTSAAEMTLFLELYDSTTNALFARVLDAQSAERSGLPFEANRVNNRAEARNVIRRWAQELAERLDEAREATARDD